MFDKYFKKRSIGINITDTKIRLLELAKDGRTEAVVGFNESVLPEGVVVNGELMDEEKLWEILSNTAKQAKPKPIKLADDVSFLMPEEQVITHVFSLVTNSHVDIAKEVHTEAINNIPFHLNEFLYTFKILEKNKTKEQTVYRIIIFATSNILVKKWHDFFLKQKIKIDSFDVEACSLMLAVLSDLPKNTIALVDIKDKVANIRVFKKYGLDSEGGFYFTEKPTTNLDFNKTYLNSLAVELKKYIEYYNGVRGGINEIIFVGEYAHLAGLIEHMTNSLLGSLTRAEGEPADKIIISAFKNIIDEQLPDSFYLVSALARKNLESKWNKIIPRLDTAFKSEVQDEKEQPVSSNKFAKNKEDESNGHNKRKGKSKKFILLFLVIFAVASISWAFWYRNKSAQKIDFKTDENSFSVPKKVNIVGKLTTDPKQYKNENIRGRLIEDNIKEGKELKTILADSLLKIEGQVQKGEKVYPTPLNDLSAKSLILPLNLQWIVYNEKDANTKVLKELKNKFNKTEFLLNKINYTTLLPIEEKGMYDFSAEVDILIKAKDIDKMAGLNVAEVIENNEMPKETTEAKPEEKSSVSSEENKATPETNASSTASTETNPLQGLSIGMLLDKSKSLVKISETGTGWLNVRSGAGKNNPVIKKVSTGEVYEYVKEENGYIEIKLSDTETGWVAKEYTEKL